MTPERWTRVGASYPATAHLKPVGSPHPKTYAGQKARLSDALHARLFFDRSDLRQLCVGMELFAHQAGPRGTEKVLLIMLGEGSTYDRQATYLN